MLNPSLGWRHPAGCLLVGLVCVPVALLGLAQTAGAASNAPPPSVDSAGQFGLTVSWQPTTSPVQAIPGQTTKGTFWVTNGTNSAIPVKIHPATAVPGNNGSLAVRSGTDQRFPGMTYTPSAFTAQPHTTTPVAVTISTPQNLSPGVYLVPAVVQPTAPQQTGNIKIEQEIDALVTFQVAGQTEAHVKPSFITPAAQSGSASSFHIPGLPRIQLGTSGSETLRVLDDSPSSFYAYNEVTATQSPFGQVVFEGHTPGDPSDLRTTPDLYFPNRYRDFPVVWSPSSAGIGVAHLHAFVSYHPNAAKIVQTETSTEVLVISPLWILVVAGYLGLLLLWARRRARRQTVADHAAPVERTVLRTIRQVVGSVVMVVVVAAMAFLARPVLLAGVGGVGAVVALVGVATARKRDRLATARRILKYEIGIAVLILAGIAATVMAGFSKWSGDIAVGILAGAGVWLVLTWWALWWNAGRTGVVPAGPESAEPPSPAEEPVPVGS